MVDSFLAAVDLDLNSCVLQEKVWFLLCILSAVRAHRCMITSKTTESCYDLGIAVRVSLTLPVSVTPGKRCSSK